MTATPNSPELNSLISAIGANLKKAVVAGDDKIRLVLVSLLSGGHLLLEDVPGVGKTLLARSLARSVQSTFKRIQFTPDLLPGDITGSSIYNQKSGEFSFMPGPIFGNIVLADEINRATPRTQSALLEAMGEGNVSIEGQTYRLPQPFFVIATQNPIESYGTFPLPEAQLDRFLITLSIGYPAFEAELTILEREEHHDPIDSLTPVVGPQHVLAMQAAARKVNVARPLKEYLLKIVTATREHPEIALGASPRSAVAFQRAVQALALIEGRNFVKPDDVKELAAAVLAHRLLVRSRNRQSTADLIAGIVQKIPVPIG
jgi:MoxR-like ATPase